MFKPTRKQQYMFSCTLPEILDEYFLSLVPRQRILVDRLLASNRIVTYATSIETAQIWVVVQAEDENEAMDLMALLPLTPYVQVEMSNLATFKTVLPQAKSMATN